MNWGMRPRDTQPRAPIAVFAYNKQAGSDFRVYYSYDVPADSAPCGETLEGIGGLGLRAVSGHSPAQRSASA